MPYDSRYSFLASSIFGLWSTSQMSATMNRLTNKGVAHVRLSMKRPSVYLISLPLLALIRLHAQKLQDSLACHYSVRQLSNLAIEATTAFWSRSQRITEQNSPGQMLNQNVSAYLNTLLSAKAKCSATVLHFCLPSPPLESVSTSEFLPLFCLQTLLAIRLSTCRGSLMLILLLPFLFNLKCTAWGLPPPLKLSENSILIPVYHVHFSIILLQTDFSLHTIPPKLLS